MARPTWMPAMGSLDCRPSRSVVLTCVAGTAVSFLLYRYLSRCYTPLDNSEERASFRSLPLDLAKQDKSHPHGLVASYRQAAVNFGLNFAAFQGLQPYPFQASSREQRMNISCYRYPYDHKDLKQPIQEDQVPRDALLTLTDTDYYVQPSVFLRGNSTLLYTFIPEEAASASGEMSFTFDDGGQLLSHVSGGAKYHHHLWDWSPDVITGPGFSWRPSTWSHWFRHAFTAPWFIWHRPSTWLSIFEGRYVYNIERRRVGPNRCLVYAAPMSYIPWYSTLNVKSRPLTRFQPTVHTDNGVFTRLQIQTKEGLLVSTAVSGSYTCATVPAHIDDAIALLTLNSKNPITPNQVEGVSNREASQVLVRFHRAWAPERAHVSPGESFYRYQFGRYDPEAKPAMVAFMEPLVLSACVPDRTPDNEAQGIHGRIEVPQLSASAHKAPAYLWKLAIEFSEHLIPDDRKGKLIPVDEDTVQDHQVRPSQRAIYDEAAGGGWFSKRVDRIISFMKAEAYNEVKDPRIISTISGQNKIPYARYILALADYLKETQGAWYVFGKTPDDVAAAVARLAQSPEALQHAGLLGDDGHRWDGNVNAFFRALDRLVAVRAFGLGIVPIMKKQYGVPGVGMMGTRYQNGFNQSSGSMDTSAFNSIRKRFIQYVAHRRRFEDKNEAWNKPCLAAGDDGLIAGVTLADLQRASADVGMPLKIQFHPRASNNPADFVIFLARYYGPVVWFGDRNSCADIYRQVAKYHLTTHLPTDMKPEQKLLEKSAAYWLTDRETPILGDLASKVLEVADINHVGLTAETVERVANRLSPIASWWAGFQPEVQFQNTYCEWMLDLARHQLPDFDFELFERQMEEATVLSDFLHLELCMAPVVPTIPPGVTVVNDSLQTLEPAQPAQDPAKLPNQVEEQAKSVKRRKQQRRRKKKGKQVPPK